VTDIQVRTYDELIEALRHTADRLGISRIEFDELAGFQAGYTGKLLGHRQVRTLGRMSFGVVLQVLGLKMVLVPDPTIRVRLQADAHADASDPISRIKIEGIRELMANLNVARNAKLSPRQRTASARNAARARWAKHRQLRKQRRRPATVPRAARGSRAAR
jgi:hypothetical protein